MSTFKFSLLILACIFSQSAYSESYYCKPQETTGFKYDESKKNWDTSNADPVDFILTNKPHNKLEASYTDTKSNKKHSTKWLVYTVFRGYTTLFTLTDKPFNPSGLIIFRGKEQFSFNRNNLRFYASMSANAYIQTGLPRQAKFPAFDSSPIKDGDLQAMFYIGTCVKTE